MERVLIAGCGYVGCRLAEFLVDEGRTVYGLKRDPSTVPDGVQGVAADVTDPDTLRALPPDLDGVVYAVSPSGRSEEAYRAAYVEGLENVLRATSAAKAPPRIILVSSTGVFGQQDGRWVDEESDPEPADATGRILLEGEGVAGGAAARGVAGRGVAGRGVVLRLGGIYGPGRDRTVRRVLDGEAGCPPPDRYGNRIHRDDAARAIRHLLELEDPHSVYIGVDRDPAPLRDVYRWIAERGGVSDPCAGARDESWEASGRRGSNKRCSSERLIASGFTFVYPTFREGYTLGENAT